MTTNSNTTRIKPGDRVRLTAGGAVMSAERVNDRAALPFAQCTWMDAHERLHRAFINLDVLELAPREDQPVP